MAEKTGEFMILIKGKRYDQLKFLAQVVLPALGTLYFALAGIWGLPSAEQVVGTIVAVDTFIGVCLQLSSTAYNKDVEDAGELHIDENGLKSFVLDADKVDVDKLNEKTEVRFKVKKKPAATD
jgi:hypothetical protein